MPRIRLFKLVVLGGGGVGKSALVIMFVLDYFPGDLGPIIEEDSYRKQCLTNDGVALLEVSDIISGHDEFNAAVLEQDIRAADGFLLVYSITSRESFEEITTAYQQILRFKEKDSFSVILLANKCDLEDEREVGIHEGQDLARHLGCTFVETSAKRCINVDEAFINLTYEIRKREPVAPAVYNQPVGSDTRSAGCRGGCVII